MHVSIEGAHKVLTRAFKEDPGILKGYIDNAAAAIMDEVSRHNESFILSRLAVREALAKAVLERIFNPRILEPLKFEVGKYYRYKTRERSVFHVLARVDTTFHGKQSLIVETLDGFTGFVKGTLGEMYEEVPREEWDALWEAELGVKPKTYVTQRKIICRNDV